MGYGVNASATLVDLFRDNFHLLYRIKTSQVVTFGKMIDDSKKPRYVQFLKIICTCNEEAVIRNQNLIVSEILDSRQHKVLMDVDASAGTIKVCDVDREPEKWVDLKVQEQRVLLQPRGRRQAGRRCGPDGKNHVLLTAHLTRTGR